MSPEASALLARITNLMERLSEQEHALHHQREVYRRAATELRMGRTPSGVMAGVAEALGLVPEITEVGGQ